MSGTPRVLVIGVDGLIGGALADALAARHVPTIGTSRRAASRSTTRRHLDLTIPSGVETLVHEADVAVLCAGIGDLAACESNPEATAAVNVSGTIAVAQTLLAAGVRVVYLSTSHVFDGRVDHPTGSTPMTPLNESGRQRAAVERALRADGGPVTIVRLAKVISSRFALFSRWRDQWSAGRVVQAFSDMPLAPVPLAEVVDGIIRVVTRGPEGVVHLSGDADVTYAEAAAIGAKATGAAPDLVKPILAALAGVSIPFSRRTALGYGPLEESLGFACPSTRETILGWFVRPRSLDGTP